MSYPKWFLHWHMRVTCRLFGHQRKPYYFNVPGLKVGWMCFWCRKIEDEPWVT